MAKTIRLSNEVHSDIIRIQGELQAESGEKHTLEDTLRRLVDNWNDNK